AVDWMDRDALKLGRAISWRVQVGPSHACCAGGGFPNAAIVAGINHVRIRRRDSDHVTVDMERARAATESCPSVTGELKCARCVRDGGERSDDVNVAGVRR